VRETTVSPSDAETEVLDVYKTEMERFEALDFDDPSPAPMWAISRVTADCERAYLLIAYNHLIVDGRGTTLLLPAITADSIDYIQTEDWETPTRLDDTISLKPSIGFLLPIAFRELFLTKLPYFIQKPFTSADPWPGSAMTRSPLEAPGKLTMVSLDADTVSRLKTSGKAHGIKTLHPLLKIAYVAAMWKVFHSTAAATPLRLAVNTARDERKAELGHAAITHNYVSSTEWDAALTGKEQFWDIAREMAHKISSPEGVHEGRMVMGLLSHVPNSDVDPTAPGFDPKKPTGWEDYFVRRASSPTPYRDSLSVSNLGLVALPAGATDLMWGQTASPFGSAYMVNIIGHNNGVRVTSGFREGSVTDLKTTLELQDIYKRIIERMCADGDMTVEEISA
jgi:hypothetical protein